MQVVTVCNHKGGCGKTTTSINLAAYLALKDKKVLLIDLDPQGAATTGLGIDKWRLNNQMYDVMVKDTPLQNIILPTEISGLFIAPCNIDLSGAEPELANQIARELILKEKLAPVKDYDYIIIDMPPRADLFLRMSIMASDYLIFSLTPTVFSDKGIPSLMIPIQKQQQIYKKENNKEFIILGAINSKTKANINTQSIISENSNDQIKRLIGNENKLFKTSIAEASVVEDSQTGNGSVLFYKPTEKTVKLYFELTLEILERIYTLEMLRK